MLERWSVWRYHGDDTMWGNPLHRLKIPCRFIIIVHVSFLALAVRTGQITVKADIPKEIE